MAEHHYNDNQHHHQQYLNGDHNNNHSHHHQMPSAHSRKTFSGHSTFPNPGSRENSSHSKQSEEEEKDNDGDNVNVVVRVRPLSAKDTEEAEIRFPGSGQILVDKGEKLTGNKPRHFTFNVAFEQDANQHDVFEHCGIRRLIEMAIDGFSCTVFAYGQTGSGKTHTLSGPHALTSKSQRAAHPQPQLDGLMQRSFHYLFQQLVEKGADVNTVIKCSYLEIYNEQVIDLLNPTQKKYLTVRWAKNKGFYVENLFLVECVEHDDILAVMEEGLRNRQVSANNVNENSSRSHSILTIHITTESKDPEDKSTYVNKYGKILFVDLAGSEKITEKVTSQGSMNETNKINRSLLTLGKCISSLGDLKKKKNHIPYRDSMLTKLLKDSIGGNAVTLMIACISPAKINVSETLNTLYYATQTKKIKNKPHIIMDPREHLIQVLKREVKKLKSENQFLKEQLHFPKITRTASAPHPAKNLVILEKLKANLHSGHFPENLQVEEVYNLMKNYVAENEELQEENSELLRNKEFLVREQEIVSRENERLTKRLENLERNPALSPGHSSLSNASLSTLSDHDSGIHTSSPTLNTRLPPHLALPGQAKPPHRLPESISKELNRRLGPNAHDTKALNAGRNRQRRNSWNSGADHAGKKRSHAAAGERKTGAHTTGSSQVRRSESDQHIRKSLERSKAGSLPKLTPHPTPKKTAHNPQR